ncbi:MAG: nucleotidyltransferase [Lachnoclostridium sp.]|nr:nucleotidyltransferase [Lachnoclostridium sp.]
MKTTGIIAEYNPFHNGHKYHLEQARRITGCDYVIVVMSGDYTQRGTPAIYSKYMRAKAALSAGADLVLEMPVYGSVASAPDFAECGVNTLAASGICDCLFFGSESGDMEQLQKQALLLSEESEEISLKIKAGLKAGLSWPDARANAFGEENPVASLPNDILGIEYLRAIQKINASITPVTLKRTDPGYHSEEKKGRFASATAARKAILTQDLDFLQEILPTEHFESLAEFSCPPVTFDDCSLLLGEKILTSTLEQLFHVSGMPEDLARKLYKQRLDFHTSDQLVAERKDRNYTYTRVNRSLLNLMLGITKEDSLLFKEYHSAPWLRILGFRKEAGPLLSEMKKKATAPIITKTANAESILPDNAYELFKKQLTAAEVYRLVSQLKSGRSTKNEFTNSILIV